MTIPANAPAAPITLSSRVLEACAAAFSGIWIQSYEHEDALRAICTSIRDHGWDILTWDPESGTRDINNAKLGGDELSPIVALDELRKFKETKKNLPDHRAVLILRNIHPDLATPDNHPRNPILLQALQHTIEVGAVAPVGLHVIVLSYPGLPILPELTKMFYTIEHDLPDAEELWSIMGEIEDTNLMPDRNSPEAKLLLDAAAGLTRIEASGAFALSLTRHKKITASTLWELKEQMLKKTGLLEMLRNTAGFDMIGGLNVLKEFCLQAFHSPHRSKKVRPKGVILVGAPGTGKSAFAAALGVEVGLPTVSLNVGSLMGGIVGQTEEQTRRALKTIDAMAPCILFAD